MTAKWAATWHPRARDRAEQQQLAADLAGAEADLETAHRIVDAAPACQWCRARPRVIDERVRRVHSFTCPLRRIAEQVL